MISCVPYKNVLMLTFDYTLPAYPPFHLCLSAFGSRSHQSIAMQVASNLERNPSPISPLHLDLNLPTFDSVASR